MQDHTAVDIATTFVHTLASGDMTMARSYVADDVVFEGPMSGFTDADSYIDAMGQFAEAVTGVSIVATLGDDERAMLMYEMHTAPFGTLRAMEYFVVLDSKIIEDTLVFDTHDVREGQAPQH
jgi:hypothetical protein